MRLTVPSTVVKVNGFILRLAELLVFEELEGCTEEGVIGLEAPFVLSINGTGRPLTGFKPALMAAAGDEPVFDPFDVGIGSPLTGFNPALIESAGDECGKVNEVLV